MSEKRKRQQIEIGKLFGLVKDPVRKCDFETYFLITATVSKEGEIIRVEKSPQSWMLFEARHKLEAGVEESLIEIQKEQPHEKAS